MIGGVLMADVLRVRVMFLFLLLLVDLPGLVTVNGLRSVRGVTVTGGAWEEVPTLRVVLWKLGLRLRLRLSSVVVSRVRGGEEVSVSEVCLAGHVVHVNSSLQQSLNPATPEK